MNEITGKVNTQFNKVDYFFQLRKTNEALVQYNAQLRNRLNENFEKAIAFLEKAGDRWWPYLGALYIVQAIKRVKGMRLIGPVWQNKVSRVHVGVPATNKMKNQFESKTKQHG